MRYKGDWNPFIAKDTKRLNNVVFGIIGLGRIGTAVALRAKAFGCDVRYYDPYAPQGKDKSIGVKQDTFENILKDSDIISLHVPSNSETRGLFNERVISIMKDDVIIINTARGDILQGEFILSGSVWII